MSKLDFIIAQITGQSLHNPTNALGNTLSQIYGSSATGYVMWNDEAPDGQKTSTGAHAKGVMGFDLDGGFLLRYGQQDVKKYF